MYWLGLTYIKKLLRCLKCARRRKAANSINDAIVSVFSMYLFQVMINRIFSSSKCKDKVEPQNINFAHR